MPRGLLADFTHPLVARDGMRQTFRPGQPP
jgi:hypothetical protein